MFRPLQTIRGRLTAVLALLLLLSACWVVTSYLDQVEKEQRIAEVLRLNSDISKTAAYALASMLAASTFLEDAMSVAEVNRREELRLLDAKFRGAKTDFELYINALTWGSDSEAFKQLAGGIVYRQWIRRGYDEKLHLRDLSAPVRQFAGSVDLPGSAFFKYSKQALKAHRSYLLQLSRANPERAQTEKDAVEKNVELARKYRGLATAQLEKLISAVGAEQTSQLETLAATRERLVANRAATLSAMIGLLIVVFYLVLQKVLMRPISALSGELGSLDFSLISAQGLRPRVDELAPIVEAIEELRRRLSSIAVSKQYFADVIDSMSDYVFVIDENFEIKLANRKANDEMIMETSLSDVSLNKIIQLPVSGVEQCHGIRTTAKLVDERRLPVELVVTRLSGEFEVRQFVLVAHDLTERQRAENLRLEQESLKRSIASLETILTVIGHELRTPIAGLRMSSELLLSLPDRNNEQAMGFLSSMLEETVNMAHVVKNLVELARLESGIKKWDRRSFELDELLGGIVDSWTEAGTSNQLVFSQENGRSFPISGDRHALLFVFHELIDNANMNTDDGQIEVSCAEEDDHYVVVVTDNGSGISEKKLERIGTGFSLNSGLVGEGHSVGAGLGLAICMRIVEAHGGRVDISSKLGEGTTVRVTLAREFSNPVRIENVEELPHVSGA